MEDVAARLNGLTHEIIGAAICVHRELGPGLLESAYEACLQFELAQRGLRVERQRPQPVHYRGKWIDCGYRIDLLVEESVVVENKAVSDLTARDEQQLLTYLRLSSLRVGLLINFNVRRLLDGVRRVVNEFPAQATPQTQ